MVAGGSALGQVLEDIHAARISTAERRRLAALAVRLALFPEPPLGHRDSEVLGRLQAVLVQVGREFGLVQPSVQAAKAELRSYGEPGRRLAGRLGRLSQVRNAAAHPDLELEKDIEELAKAGKGKSLVKGVVDLEACDEYYGIQCEDAGTQTHVDEGECKVGKQLGMQNGTDESLNASNVNHEFCTDPGCAGTDTSTDTSTGDVLHRAWSVDGVLAALAELRQQHQQSFAEKYGGKKEEDRSSPQSFAEPSSDTSTDESLNASSVNHDLCSDPGCAGTDTSTDTSTGDVASKDIIATVQSLAEKCGGKKMGDPFPPKSNKKKENNRVGFS